MHGTPKKLPRDCTDQSACKPLHLTCASFLANLRTLIGPFSNQSGNKHAAGVTIKLAAAVNVTCRLSGSISLERLAILSEDRGYKNEDELSLSCLLAFNHFLHCDHTLNTWLAAPKDSELGILNIKCRSNSPSCEYGSEVRSKPGWVPRSLFGASWFSSIEKQEYFDYYLLIYASNSCETTSPLSGVTLILIVLVTFP